MRNAKAVLLEALLVAAIGLALALAANALSSRGLRLNRNYFPGGDKPIAVNPGSNSVATGSNAAPSDPLEAVRQRLQKHGLQLVNSNEVLALFRDPRYEPGLVVFVDARDDKHYTTGHIPGAWQFHHYFPEKYLPDVLPNCLVAQQIVVYCAGGDCEDSESAAIMLRDAGVPGEKLFVYAGGYNEWTKLGLPVESGARRSGELRQPKP
jgi:rhodanese-related sulfurtransferase